MRLPSYVSRNGSLIVPAEATVSVFNPALSGAYGVYESMQVVRRRVFALAAHMERLAHSATLLDFPLPASPAVLESWINELLTANDVSDCVLRIYIIGPENGGEAAVFIWPQPVPVYPDVLYAEGATAITFEGKRYLPEAKSLNNLVSYLSRRRAQEAGVHEALLHFAGWLTEGSNSNLFAVLDGVLLTAPAHQVLSGVTRDIVLRLASENAIAFSLKPVALADISRWSECFITSTSRHIMPVTAIDGRPVGDGRSGALTRRLSGLFEAYFAQATMDVTEKMDDRDNHPSYV